MDVEFLRGKRARTLFPMRYKIAESFEVIEIMNDDTRITTFYYLLALGFDFYSFS